MENYKIILLANNVVGLETAKYLVKNREKIVALGIHEKNKQKFANEIVKVVNLPRRYIVYGNEINNYSTKKLFESLDPDIMISAFWGYIIKPYIFNIPKNGSINFHPGYLPYNRGMNPNVWPFIENTPAGVTIHYINEGIDRGDIIAQRKIKIEPIDNAGTLEKKTWREIVSLFKEVWPRIKSGKIKAKKQNNSIATFHFAKDINKIDEIFLNKQYFGKELIDKIRSRSYYDRSYAFFKLNGKKIFVKISLSYKPFF